MITEHLYGGIVIDDDFPVLGKRLGDMPQPFRNQVLLYLLQHSQIRVLLTLEEAEAIDMLPAYAPPTDGGIVSR